MVTASLFFFFFFFFLVFSTTLCNSQHYLQLPLLHNHPPSSPSQSLSFDAHRLSLLHNHHLRRDDPVTSPVVSGASFGSGQYFVDIHLGSPPQRLLLVVDTGSDLIWLRCSACRLKCHHHRRSAFLARHSSSFSPYHCYDSACDLVPRPDPTPFCNHTRLHSPCRYQYTYSDGSTTAGFFSREMTTLNTTSGQPATLAALSFGCGFEVSGPSLTGPSFNGAHGVMGLGRGPISFPSQLRRYGSKFSYCLKEYTPSPPPTSYLRFGRSESDVVSKLGYTPLLLNPLSPTFYYIGIKSVSVNGVKLPIRPSVWSLDESGNGGTVIDSGTTLTFLPEPAYRQILTAFRRSLKKASLAEPTPGFDLCVNVSAVEAREILPKLRFGLGGGSVFAPPQRNYFIETSVRVECLAIRPVETGSGFSVIGNLMQQGFLLEFDKDRGRLGFSRHGCALP